MPRFRDEIDGQTARGLTHEDRLAMDLRGFSEIAESARSRNVADEEEAYRTRLLRKAAEQQDAEAVTTRRLEAETAAMAAMLEKRQQRMDEMEQEVEKTFALFEFAKSAPFSGMRSVILLALAAAERSSDFEKCGSMLTTAFAMMTKQQKSQETKASNGA